MSCPFCTKISERIVEENEYAIWIYDGFPVSSGHSLILPKRHVASFFDVTHKERLAMLFLVDRAKTKAQETHHPDAFNIGINDGQSAGQTVPHVHLHLIPRYNGDVDDARGGLRWVLPNKADYRSGR